MQMQCPIEPTAPVPLKLLRRGQQQVQGKPFCCKLEPLWLRPVWRIQTRPLHSDMPHDAVMDSDATHWILQSCWRPPPTKQSFEYSILLDTIGKLICQPYIFFGPYKQPPRKKSVLAKVVYHGVRLPALGILPASCIRTCLPGRGMLVCITAPTTGIRGWISLPATCMRCIPVPLICLPATCILRSVPVPPRGIRLPASCILRCIPVPPIPVPVSGIWCCACLPASGTKCSGIQECIRLQASGTKCSGIQEPCIRLQSHRYLALWHPGMYPSASQWYQVQWHPGMYPSASQWYQVQWHPGMYPSASQWYQVQWHPGMYPSASQWYQVQWHPGMYPSASQWYQVQWHLASYPSPNHRYPALWHLAAYPSPPCFGSGRRERTQAESWWGSKIMSPPPPPTPQAKPL